MLISTNNLKTMADIVMANQKLNIDKIDINSLLPKGISIKTEFRGGSFSRTFLLTSPEGMFVRKIGLKKGNIHTKLKFQVEWFIRYGII